MDKIVIIGASSLQVPLVIKAKDMGYETHVFAWEDGAVAKEHADFFYPISITDKEKILKVCKKINPNAITSIASDLAVLTVNYVARELGLICNPVITDLVTTNKYEMRKQFEKNGIPSPKFVLIEGELNLNDIKNFSFPLIVKATDRSGSRGITRIDSISELENAINYAKKESFEKKAIVEEFIEGAEYSCECISFKCNHKFLAFTKKYTTNNPHYIEKGHLEPSDISLEKQNEIKKLIFEALDALGIQNGASHSEFKIDKKGNVYFIEIGSRMGGDRIGSDMVEISTGYDFLSMVVDVANGIAPTFKKKGKPRIAVVRYIFDKEDLALLHQIKIEKPELIYYEECTNEINDFKIIGDSSVRYGYFVLSCDNLDQAKKYLPNE